MIKPVSLTFCLHTDSQGNVWKAESDKENQKLASLEAAKFDPGVYRIIGVEQNYWLINELYPLLHQKSPSSVLLVGSPHICNQYELLPENVDEILTCIRSLTVYDSLSTCWHSLSSCSFNTFLLLQAFKEEQVSDRVRCIYAQHPLRKYFDFLGLKSAHLAVQFIAEIVDPRWYLNATRMSRLSKLESRFGLKDSQFEHIVKDQKLMPSRILLSKRNLFLLEILKSLDWDSCVFTETGLEDFATNLNVYKWVFRFLVRNWLQELKVEDFNPDLFFRNPETRKRYRQIVR